MGLAGQLVAWPVEFCEKLVARGHFVIRFDNRDVGLSTKMEDAGLPRVMAALGQYRNGRPVNAPYTLSDMALDAIGLMDALGIERAHVCGLSMGGMIVQTMAGTHPERVRSLISMECGTGDPTLPPPSPEAIRAMMSPPPQDRTGNIEHMVGVMRAFSGGSPLFDANVERHAAELSYDRSFYPVGFARQLTAIYASGNRTQQLGSVSAPTLVIHGAADPLAPLEHGKATAAAINGAKLFVIQGLGHGISYPALWDTIVDEIAAHTARAS
ncbi:MAG: alpha/beta fold hydrolase [Deltaproteobacteria bacterium]|nr:alpha/beta fold hydrolase [Deltaproteobacteria bacterium]